MCWHIVNGDANKNDFEKTTMHECHSHTMKILKYTLTKIPQLDRVFNMYCISLLCDVVLIQQADQILNQLLYIFGSEYQIPLLNHHLKSVINQINALDGTDKEMWASISIKMLRMRKY